MITQLAGKRGFIGSTRTKLRGNENNRSTIQWNEELCVDVRDKNAKRAVENTPDVTRITIHPVGV